MGIEITCDVCDQSTWREPNFEYARLTATWGYGSLNDGDTWDEYLCSECANAVMFLIEKRKEGLNKQKDG